MFSASGTARARRFCTHERTRTTESTVFEHIHHKDRRQLQLFQRLAVSFSRHIRLTSFCAFVRSRRRPEKWTRTRKWDSRGRKTVDFVCICTHFGLHFFHKTTVAGDAAAAGGAGGDLRGRASLVTFNVLTGHICSVSLCLYVPTEREKYVWLVQSRRRPEKWTRTRKADSRGSATPDPVS